MIDLFFIHIVSHKHLIIVESHEEGDDDEGEDDEDDEGDEAEEAGEENDRPYNLRQRKTVQRYEAPPIGTQNYLPIKFLENHTIYFNQYSYFYIPNHVCPFVVPVNRKQSKNTVFDTHRSPARRSHIRCVTSSVVSFL